MAQQVGTIGNITTSNYTYYVSVAGRFSYLERSDVQNGYDQLRKDYLWPMNRMDTNSADKFAMQSLAAVPMDVTALSRDCEVHIEAFIPEGKSGRHFAPLYWVYWTAKAHGNSHPVELVEPTKIIRQLRVNRPEYILRKPIIFTNLDYLLAQTNAPAGTNAPAK